MGAAVPIIATIAGGLLSSAVSGSFSKKSEPSQPAPPPPPPAPILQDPAKAEQTAKDEQRRRLASSRGTQTILTAPTGDPSNPNIQRKTLLGISAS